MTLRVRYNRVTTAGGVEPDTVTVRPGVAFSSAAEEGSVAMSEVIVDDTANALDYIGRRRLYAYETACQAHNQIVFNGYLQGRKIGRLPAEGPDSDEEVMGRRWTLAVGDTNSLLSRRLITGPDGYRPDETDVARVQWLLDSNDAYLSNPQDNWENPSPYVDTSGPVNMSAANYIGRTAFDVLNDCAQRSGKNWFVRYYEANDSVPPTNAGSYALWYARADSTQDSSTLRLTNVDADVDDAVTFAVLPDAQLSRDPTRAYSGSYLTYDGGSRYDQSTNVVNLFQRQDAAVSNPFVKTDAEAASLNTRYLADAESEDDRLTARFICAKQYVNDLREGQRFEGKFAHFDTPEATYSEWTWWRCLRRTVKHLNDEAYELSIEASPTVPACTASVLQTKANTIGTLFVTFDTATTVGKVLFAYETSRDGICDVGDTPSFTWTALSADVSTNGAADGDHGRWWYGQANGGTIFEVGTSRTFVYETDIDFATFDPATDVTLYEVDNAGTSTTLGLGAVTSPTTGQLILYGATYDTAFNGSLPATPGAGWTLDYNANVNSESPPVGASDQHPHTLVMRWDGTTTPLTGSATISSGMPYCGVMIQIDSCA